MQLPAWCLGGLVAGGMLSPGEAPRLNVVLILADDLGWTDLHCYGSTFYETPHIDRLAAEGVRFTQNYSACTVCSPTRAALLTGKYPARLYAWRREVGAQMPTTNPNHDPSRPEYNPPPARNKIN